MRKHVSRSKKISFEISILFTLSSIIWIYSTEWLLTKFYINDVFWISIAKGFLFVIATGFFINKLIYRNMKDIENREKQLNSLVDNNMDALVRLDINGHFISANRVTEKITGYSEEELTNMTMKDLISKEDLDKVQTIFWK